MPTAMLKCTSLVYTKITPPDIVSRCKIMSPNRATASIWIVLGYNFFLFQLLQNRSEERPGSIQLITSDKQPPFTFNSIQQKPLICVWDLFGISTTNKPISKASSKLVAVYMTSLLKWIIRNVQSARASRSPSLNSKEQLHTPIYPYN